MIPPTRAFLARALYEHGNPNAPLDRRWPYLWTSEQEDWYKYADYILSLFAD